MAIRISELLGSKEKKTKNNKLRIGLLITGALSLLIVLVTLYGQYAGNAVITMTKQAKNKGIALSESRDFNKQTSTIKFNPLNEVEDILEGALNIGEAENTDGIYYDNEMNYFGYTFYLKNTGTEIIDIGYTIKITQEKNNLAKATFFKVRQSSMNNNQFVLDYDTNYSKALTKNDQIANTFVGRLLPGEIKKYTLLVWLDGEYTDASMIAGYVKFDWTFVILNTGGDN